MKFSWWKCPICGNDFGNSRETESGICGDCHDSIESHFGIDPYISNADKLEFSDIVTKCKRIAEEIPDNFCDISLSVRCIIDDKLDDIADRVSVENEILYTMHREFVIGMAYGTSGI